MGVAEAMWAEIASGRAPDEGSVQRVVARDTSVFSRSQRAELARRIEADVLAAGPLEQLLATPGVTDVLVNSPTQVWVDRGAGLERAAVQFDDVEAVRRLAVRLANSAGRRLDDAAPFVDAVLPGGARLHAILPPLVEGCAHISLRVPGAHRPNLHELVASGSVPANIALVLEALIASKVAFVVSGGTGSGKTTLLGALLGYVSPDERIMLVEDVRELVIEHPHVVRLEARRPNVEGVGEVDLVALVRQSLRMRPDRVVIGEVRGSEVRELMAALNTGHAGGCGTIHANAPADVPARFEALGALAGMRPQAVRTQLRSAIQLVLHVERVAGQRRLASIGVVAGDHDELRVEVAWSGEGEGPAWGQLQALVGLGPRPLPPGHSETSRSSLQRVPTDLNQGAEQTSIEHHAQPMRGQTRRPDPAQLRGVE